MSGIHIISQKPLREFWQIHPNSEEPLRAWIRIMEKTDFPDPEALKKVFATKVDQVNQFTVFDIGGNKFRLITVIDYARKKVFIRHILTHNEYDQEKWKKDTFAAGKAKSRKAGHGHNKGKT